MKKGNLRKLIRNMRKKNHEKIKIQEVTTLVSERQKSQRDSVPPQDDNNQRRE